MTEINSLYDAIIKTQVEENQCTNFLVWLIDKLPSIVLSRIFEKSKLSISTEIQNNLSIDVQYPLENSIPDAIIEFYENKYLIIETKLYPNAFIKSQFINHLKGGYKKFGKENIWLMFLSGDKNTPAELNELIAKHQGKIGFISWDSLLELLKENEKSLGEKYELIIKEFLIFANHYKLGRLISMNNEEMKQYFEKFAELEKFKKPCTDKLVQIIDMYKDRIIIDSREKVKENEENDGKNEELPCIYKCLEIEGWHTDYSAYIYINILQKLIGVCLTGYEYDKNVRNKFSKLWTDNLKDKYQKDLKLKSLTWVEEGDDELAINGGYFKVVEGTTGKSFNPTDTAIFSKHFYFGYVYELNVPELEALTETIANDFKTLLERFTESRR